LLRSSDEPALDRRQPDHVADNVLDAVQWVLQRIG
jgi:hypothetical protein